MDKFSVDSQASEDFNKARAKEMFSRIIHLLRPQKNELLSYAEIKSLLRPKAEIYRGMQSVPIDKIVGSEGRYRDFNNAFLPKHEYLRGRWESVDKARLKDVILPPIKLYQVGDAYFVRDGNHRVSVAKAQGVGAIDAEVTQIKVDFQIDPSMTKTRLNEELIKYEKERFIQQTHLDTVIPMDNLEFSSPGRFDEILVHIQGHKYYINQGQKEEISFEDAAVSWYFNVFQPIVESIDADGLISRFPGRTKADLYTWIVNHWAALKQKYGEKVSMRDAARDFSNRFGKSLWEQFLGLFKKR